MIQLLSKSFFYLASCPHISREELSREKEGQSLDPELANRKRVLGVLTNQRPVFTWTLITKTQELRKLPTWRLNIGPSSARCLIMKEKVENIKRLRIVSTRELKYIALREQVIRMRARVSEENRRHTPITMAAM